MQDKNDDVYQAPGLITVLRHAACQVRHRESVQGVAVSVSRYGPMKGLLLVLHSIKDDRIGWVPYDVSIAWSRLVQCF